MSIRRTFLACTLQYLTILQRVYSALDLLHPFTFLSP
jgi:hypothetical protein